MDFGGGYLENDELVSTSIQAEARQAFTCEYAVGGVLSQVRHPQALGIP